MGRIKAKRLTEDELIARELDETKPNLPAPVEKNRAICHPSRLTYADGWCEKCWNKRRALQPQALDGKVENELAAMFRTNEQLEKIVREARQVMENNLKTYAELHMQGATIAAAKGDTRPVEWLLSRAVGDMKPAVAEPSESGGKGDSGVKVLINIPLGGLPVQPEVIDIEKKA